MDFQPVRPNVPAQPQPVDPTYAQQTPPAVPQQQAPQHKSKGGHKFLTFCLIVIIAAACAGGVYYWQHKKVTDANAQVATVSSQAAALKTQLTDQQNALAALPNIVQTSTGDTTDLAVFLGSDNTGCYKQSTNGQGFYKIDNEVNDQFAQIEYGCQNTYSSSHPAFTLAVKASGASGQWKLISPTNQWPSVNGTNYPTCTMINDNKISKLLEPKCAVASATNATQFTLQAVTNP